MFSVVRRRTLYLVCLCCLSLAFVGCKRLILNCDGGEAIIFSKIGKAVLRDSICVVCPDGSQYHLLSKPRQGQSFLFVQGNSLNQPLVVTVHSHLLDNRTEDHLYLLDTADGMLQA